MEKHEKSYDTLCQIEERLCSLACYALENASEVDAKELGEVVDMIKDMAEAKHHCMEAAEIKQDMEEPERMGYNARRYASGRYAPAGRGERMGYERMGYEPITMNEWRYDDHEYGPSERMGYTEPTRTNTYPNRTVTPMTQRTPGNTAAQRRMGMPYDEYQAAKRHYTETNTVEARKEMERHAEEHMREMADSVKDIWAAADPTMRQKVRQSLNELANALKD